MIVHFSFRRDYYRSNKHVNKQSKSDSSSLDNKKLSGNKKLLDSNKRLSKSLNKKPFKGNSNNKRNCRSSSKDSSRRLLPSNNNSNKHSRLLNCNSNKDRLNLVPLIVCSLLVLEDSLLGTQMQLLEAVLQLQL